MDFVFFSLQGMSFPQLFCEKGNLLWLLEPEIGIYRVRRAAKVHYLLSSRKGLKTHFKAELPIQQSAD